MEIRMIIGAVFTVILSFAITWSVTPYLISRAGKWGLVDHPGGRKTHLKATPLVGGIAVLAGILCGVILSGFAGDKSLLSIFAAIIVLFIVGIIDDHNGLSAGKKWMGQVIASAIMIWGGAYIKTFHGILGISGLPTGALIFISVIFITGLVNAMNLIDGMDGLVGGIAAINFTIFGMLFYLRADHNHAVFALTIAASLVAFLLYNFAPAKIFMGDAGSLLLGGVLAYFFITVWNEPRYREDLYIAVGLVSFPIFDMVRVFIYRLLQKRSPFLADRSHFHHYLRKTKLHHAVATLIMYILNMLLILQAILLSSFTLEKFIIANLLFFLVLFFLVREHSGYYKDFKTRLG